MTALLVVAGAALGAPLRYLAGHYLDRELAYGTLLANLAGSFLLGLFSGLSMSGDSLALLGTGFCGALTTYSAFAVKATEHGVRLGVTYALLTVGGALAACGLGFWVGQA